ncbi:MAG: hypothetical protein WC755_01460 [Candidatus Woesearchaeota archaeon]|jgi:hypothetical protein
MNKNKSERGLEIICELAKELNVDLKQPEYALASDLKKGIVKTQDGSMVVNLFYDDEVIIKHFSGLSFGVMYLLKKEPIIRDRLGAPEGAIYQIKTFMSDDEFKKPIQLMYIGQDGRIIGEPR